MSMDKKTTPHCDICDGICQLAEGYSHRSLVERVVDDLVDDWRAQRRRMPRDMRPANKPIINTD